MKCSENRNAVTSYMKQLLNRQEISRDVDKGATHISAALPRLPYTLLTQEWCKNGFPDTPFLGAANCEAARGLPNISWSLAVYRRAHKSIRMIPTLSGINSVHPTSLRTTLMLSTHYSCGLPSGLLPSNFPTSNLHAFLLSLARTAYITLDLIMLIILIDGSWRDREGWCGLDWSGSG
jgi:hypothetical protein